MVADTDAVELEMRVEASPETLFAFFVEPEKMVRWMGRDATLEPRPGGLFRVDINGRNTALGEYVAVEPHRRVVFTFGWDEEGHPIPAGSSTVEVTLTPDGNGTIVKLSHRGLREEARLDHRHGWQHYLERLVVAGAGGDAGPDSFAEPAS
ncbi:MAG: SRPBCC domain-containing protein [Dehalococcoidia bacterium]